ncbi:probable LRR receptor-like serine/threonine-protein kinase At2g16250 [Salvia miltiorrhiza]|uniref:probable LRR receptor-like serine/threonine-protein kinase At2g16250 n=1 Tax=Salvia miltiorrhiza TaxID=226208 RepID=UPI0025AD6C82|nr:probable LRR receptor-like serine/threonine-protein kinase At2g16250 [Salvia miltiorrhiza]
MAPHLKLPLLLLPLALLLSSAAAQSPPRLTSPTERRALLDLRSSLGISAKNWHKKTNPCLNWTGIECRNGRVTAIKLSGLRRSNQGKKNPRFAVDSLQNFPFLSTLNSSGFLLPGQIPDWLGTKLSNLESLDLSSSSITGPIPLSLGSLSSLTWLNLSNNSITGNMPIALQKLQSLSVLDLSQNSLTGQIPEEISSLRNLTNLDLSSNYLSGAIPLDFVLLSKLKQLNLSRNSLSSSIPSQIANLSEMEQLDLGFNYLSGALPQELGGLRSLKYLDVSRNNLTGLFPGNAASFNVTAAVFFNFSDNRFYGNVSSRFGNALVVDLSSNYFRGQAPTESRFRLSNNCFSSIQKQRKLENCTEFYKGVGIPYDNDDGDSDGQQPMPPTLMEPRRKSRSRLFYVMIGVFGGIGLIFIFVVAALLVLLRSRRARSSNQQAQSRDVEQPPKFVTDLSSLGESFTFEQLLVATSNFSNENLIKQGHSGCLFRARLEGGELAVVKKVDLQSIRRELFVAELELFGKAAHQRLVPLVGHCLDDENVKFFVYKYMPNGDLSNALYRLTSSEEGLQSLDWITRLKIAIGAAEALSYLHNECTPPLVHRDVQASSILLDDKYEVRLGSFSEACVSGANNHQNVVSRLTSGRCGSSSTTCAYDVYCLGKVLLELVTGKLGISTMSDADAQQWLDSNLPFISIYDKEMVHKIVDQSLIVDEDLLEEVWAVAVVAKSCLNPKASRRPSMRHVVKALENPFKVVRDENFSSGRLRRGSSRQSWTAALFGSWHHSSSDSSNMSSQTNKEIIGGLRQTERAGSRGSGTNDHSSSHKRSSSDVFPQPLEMQDVESGN